MILTAPAKAIAAAGINGVDTTLTNGKGYRTNHSGAIRNETAAATDLEGKGASDSDATAGGSEGSKFCCK